MSKKQQKPATTVAERLREIASRELTARPIRRSVHPVSPSVAKSHDSGGDL